MLAELVAVFLFVSVIITVATDDSAPWKGVMAPVAIGGFIFTAAVTIGPTSGGSLQPGTVDRPGDLRARIQEPLDLHRRPADRCRHRRWAVDGAPRTRCRRRHGSPRRNHRNERDPPGGEARLAPAVPAEPDLLDRDGLREVARLVDVQAAQPRDPVGEQLQRHDGEHRLQERRRARDVDHVVGVVLDVLVAVASRSRSRARRAPGPPGCSRRSCRRRGIRVATTTTGVFSSSSAIGPCFISPAE